MPMTLAESMAIAVLKGDRVAAYALADRLLEERDEGADAGTKAARALREQNLPTGPDGYGVYFWPEFQAFCRRAGILWDLGTTRLVIHLNEGEALRIEHEYLGKDAGTEPTIHANG